MQVNMAQKASGIEDRRMKTSPFERGEDFISSDDRNKKHGAGPGVGMSSVMLAYLITFGFLGEYIVPIFKASSFPPLSIGAFFKMYSGNFVTR